MKLVNFKIESSFTEISYGDFWIDLHNDYIWTKTINDGEIMKLIYEKINAEWVNDSTPLKFCIKIEGVNGIWEKGNDSDYPIDSLEDDKNTPDLFGYSYFGDKIMEGPADFKKSNDDLVALIFTTIKGRTLKVSGESAEIIEMKNL